MYQPIKPATFLVLVLVAGCAALKSAAPRDRIEQNWNQVRGQVKHQLAQQQYDSGLFKEAALTASESLALDPGRSETYVLLARADLELDKPASAQQALDAARHAGFETPDLLYTEGVILEQRGEIDAALMKYERARMLDPKNVDDLVAQAECLVTLGRTAEALALLERHANQVDEKATVSALAAHIAAMSGRTDEAATRFRQAVLPEGRADLVAEDVGVLLAHAGRCFEALTVLRPLLEAPARAPVSAAVRRAAAKCQLSVNDPDAAVKTLAEYARSHPDDTSAQILLAKAAIAAGEVWTARYALDLAEQRAPNHSEVKFVRALLQWKRGEYAAATASLDEVLARQPDDVEAHCLMAEALLAQKQPAAARRHFEQALQIDPGCTWARHGLQSLG